MSQGKLTSTDQITIAINAPPSPGLFTVSPKNGTAITTIFTMAASLWSDPDLPLEYAFGFLDALESIRLQENIKKAFTTTLLGVGQDTSDYNVTCHLRVYDSFSAFSSLNAVVQVNPLVIAPAALLSRGDKRFVISFSARLIDLFTLLPYSILFCEINLNKICILQYQAF